MGKLPRSNSTKFRVPYEMTTRLGMEIGVKIVDLESTDTKDTITIVW